MLRPVMRPLMSPVVVRLGEARRRGGVQAMPAGYHGAFHVTIPTATKLTAFETMTGRAADMICRFGVNTDADTTPANSLSVLNTYAADLPAGRMAHWSLPLAWPTVTMAQVAAGNADSFYPTFPKWPAA